MTGVEPAASCSQNTRLSSRLHPVYFLPICQRTLYNKKKSWTFWVQDSCYLVWLIFYSKIISLNKLTELVCEIRGYQQLLNCDFTLMTICCLLVFIVFFCCGISTCLYNYYKVMKNSSIVKLVPEKMATALHSKTLCCACALHFAWNPWRKM